MLEILVSNCDPDGHRAQEIPSHKDAILIMVKRGHNLFIPHGQTYLGTGDILSTFGRDSALENTKQILS